MGERVSMVVVSCGERLHCFKGDWWWMGELLDIEILVCVFTFLLFLFEVT